jgi:crotonobetainyl-CoA:carnitine CoA-transferase CaiB-like acyl-CoA transferase
MARAGQSVLNGIRVIEMGGVAAVPFCGLMLSWLGAEVVKFEPAAGSRDDRRQAPFAERVDGGVDSAMFAYLNSGKRMVSFDERADAGRGALARLVAAATVVVHDGSLDICRTALGPTVGETYPGLVSCAITPYGWDGPHAALPACDLITNAVGGDCYLNPAGLAHREQPDGAPLKMAGFSASYTGGLAACLAILAGLFRRGVTGAGDFIDVSEQDVQVSMSREQIMWAVNENVLETRDTRALPVGGCFECKDGHVQVYVFSDEHWAGLRELMGRPAWAQDERFALALDRARYHDEVNAGIADWVRLRERAELYEAAKKHGVTLAPYLAPADVLADQHEVERGFLAPFGAGDPVAGMAPSFPFRMAETMPVRRGGGWALGQDTAAVLAAVGVPAGDITALGAGKAGR